MIFSPAPEIQGYKPKRALQCGLLYLCHPDWIRIRTDSVYNNEQSPSILSLTRLQRAARDATLADLHSQGNIDKPDKTKGSRRNMARSCLPILATDRCPQIDLKPCYRRYPADVTQRVHHNWSGPLARFFCRINVPLCMNDFLGVDCVL